MKKIILCFSFLVFQFNFLNAQEFCDSTFSVCDSIFIDSIVVTNFASTGDRVHFFIRSNHNSLYAPSFLICPMDDTIEFENNQYGYFAFGGPINITPYYEFLNFELVEDSLVGQIIVNNSNNSFQNCEIDFKVAVSKQTTSTKDNWLDNEIEIFPNPVKHNLSIVLKNDQLNITNIQLIDLFGKKLELDSQLPAFDFSKLSSGLYLLQLEINETKLITKKLIVQ